MTCFASSNIVLPSSVSVRNKLSSMGALEHVQHILDAVLPFTINNHTRLQHTRTAQGFSKSRLLLEITQSGDSRCLQSLWWWLARLTHSRREGQRAECVFRQGCWSFWNLKHWDEAVRGGTALENSTNKVIISVLESFFSMLVNLNKKNKIMYTHVRWRLHGKFVIGHISSQNKLIIFELLHDAAYKLIGVNIYF